MLLVMDLKQHLQDRINENAEKRRVSTFRNPNYMEYGIRVKVYQELLDLITKYAKDDVAEAEK